MEQNEVVAQWHGLDEPCRDREWGWKGSVQHTGLCAPACLQSHHKAQKLWAQRDAQTLPQRKLLERNVFMSSFCTQEQFRTHQKPLTPKRCWKLSHGSVTFSLLIHAWKKNRYSTEYLPFPRYCLVWLYCMINYYNQKKKKEKKAVKKQDCINTSHTNWALQNSVSVLHFPVHLWGHLLASKHFSSALRMASKAAFIYN